MTAGPLVVGVLSARSPEALRRLARSAAAARADLLELRLDALDPAVPLETALGAAAGARPLVLTCRPEWEGGGYRGDEADRRRLLRRAAAAAPAVRFVDVELRAVDGASLPDGAGRIVSFHDFSGTPPHLEELARSAVATGAEHVKIVTTPARHADVARVLELNGRALRSDVTAFGMGETGFPSRVLSAARGGALVYAAIDAESASAPGQETVDVLLDRYRVRSIGPRTRVYGIAGDPVRHSLSPRLHNALFARHGIDAVYLPFRAVDFRDLWSARGSYGLEGLSVTIPHKVTAARLADALDPLAGAIGAVNTLVRASDGASRFTGHNTDADAAIEGLEAAAGGPAALSEILARGETAVAGAGGAARAIGHALRSRGAERGVVLNRDAARAAVLASELGWTSAPLEALARLRPALLVQATSAGMGEGRGDETVVPESILGPGTLVFEAVYSPPETRLVRDARARGATVVPGTEMFVRQAARQFLLFTGVAVDLGSVRRALLQGAEAAP